MSLIYTQEIRTKFVALVNSLNLKQLNTISSNFSNNIVWHFGHVIVTQQLLCYTRANLKPRISTELIERFKSGTIPVKECSNLELHQLIDLASHLLETFEDDYQHRDFSNYNSFTNSFNCKISSIKGAISFLPVHEAYHFGVAYAQYKLL